MVPFTVMLKVASPTFLLVGLMLVVVGTGLMILNALLVVVVRPGLVAVRLYVPVWLTVRLPKLARPVALLVVTDSVPPRVAVPGTVNATVTVGSTLPFPHALTVTAGVMVALTKVLPGCCITVKPVLPVSVNVPALVVLRFVPLVTDEPVIVMLPGLGVGKRQPVGMTCMPDQVIRF